MLLRTHCGTVVGRDESSAFAYLVVVGLGGGASAKPA